MLDKKYIKSAIAEMQDELIEIRQYLHAHPELSFEEEKTAAYLSSLLNDWGLEHQTNIGGYGICGLLKGKNPDKKVIALRADMDALPIIEDNDLPYKSMEIGVMHACGHDVHMTCLLGVINFLRKHRDEFEGTIKYIFQPAEETLPGGALKMIEAGVLENPEPELIVAQHVFPELEAGKLGFKEGVYMASSDEVNIVVEGRGGHAAIPERYDYTVMAAAELISEINSELNNEKPTDFPSVLAFGEFKAEGAYNVIPSQVKINGTFRTFNEDWRKRVHGILKNKCSQIPAKYNCKAHLNIKKGYPVLKNNENLTAFSRAIAEDFLGKQNIEDLKIRTTVEDFARFAQQVPACFYRLGIANNEKGINSNLHTSTFNIDEKALLTGTSFMAYLALELLDQGKHI